jgi:hypothetical protein
MALSEDEILEIGIAAFARQPKLAALPVGQSSYAGQRCAVLGAAFGASPRLGRAVSARQLACRHLRRRCADDSDQLGSPRKLGLHHWRPVESRWLRSQWGGARDGWHGDRDRKRAGYAYHSGAVLSDPSGTVLLQLRTGVVVDISGNISIIVDA